MKRGFAFEKLFKKKLPGKKPARRPVVSTNINIYGQKQSKIRRIPSLKIANHLVSGRSSIRRINGGSRSLQDVSGALTKTVVILFLVGIGYFVFGSSFFILNTLEIKGNRLVELTTLEQTIFKNGFKPTNALFFNEEKAINKILSISQVRAVTFNKDILGHKLVMIVDEHETSLIWQTNNQRFLVNRAGVAYDLATLDNPLTVVEDLKNVPVDLNQKILTTGFIEFVNFVAANLARKTPLNARKITVPETTFELEIETNEGWRIIFDTSKSPDIQLNNLSKVLQGGAVPNEYIDLRIPDRVYYK